MPIDEKTLIPLWLAFSVIGGGAIWLTTIHVQTTASAATLKEISEKQDRYTQAVEGIREDIAEIKGELKRLRK